MRWILCKWQDLFCLWECLRCCEAFCNRFFFPSLYLLFESVSEKLFSALRSKFFSSVCVTVAIFNLSCFHTDYLCCCYPPLSYYSQLCQLNWWSMWFVKLELFANETKQQFGAFYFLCIPAEHSWIFNDSDKDLPFQVFLEIHACTWFAHHLCSSRLLLFMISRNIIPRMCPTSRITNSSPLLSRTHFTETLRSKQPASNRAITV